MRTDLLVKIALVAAYGALLWFVVFPWADRTFINSPSL